MKKKTIRSVIIVLVVLICSLSLVACNIGVSSSIPKGFKVEKDGLVVLTEDGADIKKRAHSDEDYLIDVVMFYDQLLTMRDGREFTTTIEHYKEELISGYDEKYTGAMVRHDYETIVHSLIFELENGEKKYWHEE